VAVIPASVKRDVANLCATTTTGPTRMAGVSDVASDVVSDVVSDL